MKKLVFSALLCLIGLVMHAQQNPALKGKVIDSKSQRPLQNVAATIQSTNVSVVTDATGNFEFKSLPSEQPVLVISYTGYRTQTLVLEPTTGETLDLGTIVLEEDITSEQQLSLVTLTENDLGDENSGSESTSGLLQASRDTYQQIAAFNWGQAYFRIRGLDNANSTVMINGIVMNKQYDGRPQWSNWGGLNDATRNQEFTMGSAPSDYNFGNALGTTEINTRASHYRTGNRISMSGTNTNYSWRTMGTHASGLNKKGWAFVVSASRRWAKEGHFEGTDYSANSLFASVEKKFNDKHSLNFTSIYAENSRGKNSPNTKEVNDIMGVRYNSYWGWQDGKKRNSRDKDILEPINILSHYWKINENTSLNTNVAYQTGKIGNSRLDYQGVPNPDPTYYRNLPSYYLNNHDNQDVWTPDYYNADRNLTYFKANSQINWDAMYETNQSSNSDGRNRSFYVLYEDRTDDTQWSANTILNTRLANFLTLNAAVNFRHLKSHNFQNLLDLLGGDYYRDIDNFGFGDQQQSDLNNMDRDVVEGDTFGYNYNTYSTNIDAFTQFKFNFSKVDFYLSQMYSRTEYQREGLYKNGYHPLTSFGKSKKIEFDNFGFKGGLTYKINGRNHLDFNGLFMTKAPFLKNTFDNARVDNSIVKDIDSEEIVSFDGSYILKAPKLKARLTGYYSKISNSTEISYFFTQGSTNSGFYGEVVRGIDKQNMGAELGIEYQLTTTIKAKGAASYGQFTYANNPSVYLNLDELTADDPTIDTSQDQGIAYLKNYKLPGMPQQAYSFGLEYNDPHFWWVGANVNFLQSTYVDIASLLRTDNFSYNAETGVAFPDATEDNVRSALTQEKFDDYMLLNLVGGKSWRLSSKNRNTFGFFASINNLLDVEYKTGGFEQSRGGDYKSFTQQQASGTSTFGSKYFYGYGRTYFVNFFINF